MTESRSLLPCPWRADASAAFATIRSGGGGAGIFAPIFASSLDIAIFHPRSPRRDRCAPTFLSHAHLLSSRLPPEACARIAELENCSRQNPITYDATRGRLRKLWALRRAFSNSLRATGLTKLNQDIVVPRSRLVDLVELAATLEARHGFPIATFGHAGDGNIHVNIMAANYEAAEVRVKVEQALDELFAQVLAWGGVITGEHGIGLAKKRWWPAAAGEVSRALHERLKRELDPANILNPGKLSVDGSPFLRL